MYPEIFQTRETPFFRGWKDIPRFKSRDLIFEKRRNESLNQKRSKKIF